MKKVIIGISIAGTVLGGIAVTDYFVDSIDVYSSIMGIFSKDSSNLGSNLVGYNNTAFTPMIIEGKLEKVEYIGDSTIVPIAYKTDIVKVPVIGNSYSTTYSDTIYSDDGSFYMVLSEDKTDKGAVSDVTVTEYSLGRGEPVVIEVRFPNTTSVLYVQCYSPEAYGFYSEVFNNQDAIEYSKVDKLGLSDDDLAVSTSIPDSIIPSKGSMALENKYINITKEFRTAPEGSTRFTVYGDNKVSYYRAVGFLDTHMRCEYARLTAMGYTPIEYGSYSGISYIKFDGFIVLGYNVTNNSCLIYYVS